MKNLIFVFSLSFFGAIHAGAADLPPLLLDVPISEVSEAKASDVILKVYTQRKDVQSALKVNPSLAPKVTRLQEIINQSGNLYYRATAEIIYEKNSKSFYGYFIDQTRIYDVLVENTQLKLYDVTEWSIPSKGLWAHFAVLPHTAQLSKDSETLSRFVFHGTEIFYHVPTANDARVFIPIKNKDLVVNFRKRLASGQLKSFLFWLKNQGTVTLGDTTPEVVDGGLSFALKGGAAAGWGPWSSKFLGIVGNVQQGQLNKIVPAEDKLAPPLLSL